MTINWQLPVETYEDPPRPVMVLYALGNDTPYGFIVYNVTKTATDEFWLMTDENRPVLRNTPPKPVLIEGWVNFVVASTVYEGGTAWVVRNGAVWGTKDAAHIEAGKMRDVIGTAFIRAMSDGSPVPASPEQFDQMRDMAKIIQDRDSWRTKAEALNRDLDSRIAECGSAWDKCDEWRTKAEALQAEVTDLRRGELGCSGCEWADAAAVMKPVVDAAVAWADRGFTLRDPWEGAVFEAVRAFQNQQPAPVGDNILDGIIDSIRDAIRGEPVKNCMTCRWDASQSVCGAKGCNGEYSHYKGWEAKS